LYFKLYPSSLAPDITVIVPFVVEINLYIPYNSHAYPDRAKGVHDLWKRVEKEWDTFTKEDCRKYIDSMPKRIEAVIKAKGGYTKY
jgi:hypothetical protein